VVEDNVFVGVDHKGGELIWTLNQDDGEGGGILREMQVNKKSGLSAKMHNVNIAGLSSNSLIVMK